MTQVQRRKFLAQVGRGMLAAGVGTSLAMDLGILHAAEIKDAEALSFGDLEPLVSMMQELEPDTLVSQLAEELKRGTSLQTLTAAGALANARTFGGCDYIGYHTFMALAPAYRMSQQLPSAEQPIPVLKVLHRNATRIQAFGGKSHELLHAAHDIEIPAGADMDHWIRETSRSADVQRADDAMASVAKSSIGEAFNHLQFAIEDEVDVHRVVLAWRAWDTWELAGEKWAEVFLRQSLRYCADTERQIQSRSGATSAVRDYLPKLLDQYHLAGFQLGTRMGNDEWLAQLAKTIFRGSREQAADAVAQAIAEGFAPDQIGEAISQAASHLVLHDPGRPQEWSNSDKPRGSCHGDSVGVHASDAANAWRHIARVSNARNTVCSLIVGAYHTGGQSQRSNASPYPTDEQLAESVKLSSDQLLPTLKEAILSGDQLRAAALASDYCRRGLSSTPIFQALLQYATSEDGALHAEKYYNTVSEEYATTRSAFRSNHLIALARVSASECGHPSLGYQSAKKHLGLS